jgi:hypothetical protein
MTPVEMKKVETKAALPVRLQLIRTADLAAKR